jgi:hypothetical protein
MPVLWIVISPLPVEALILWQPSKSFTSISMVAPVKVDQVARIRVVELELGFPVGVVGRARAEGDAHD